MQQQASDTIDASRRLLTKALSLALTLPLLPRLACSAAGTSRRGITLEQFRILSIYLTRYARLNPEMLRAIHTTLMHEPWGPEHLARLLHRLFPDLPTSSKPRTQLLVPRNLDDAERWFAGHILTTWMTGIYYHETGNHTISYEHALMYESLKDIRPVPGMSDLPFGFWQDPPTARE